LLKLLDKFLAEDVEMDSIEDVELSNQAQKIVYESIYNKFIDLADSRSQFKDESERLYIEEIRKYERE